MNNLEFQTITSGLKNNEPEIIEWIYTKFYPKIKRFVLLNRGNVQDAEDLFQDIIIIMFRKVQANTFDLKSSFGTFFLSVCKNLWLKKLRDTRKRQLVLSSVEYIDVNTFLEIEFMYDEVHKDGIYQKQFLNLSERCQELLSLYFKKIPLKKIAEIMNFPNENFVKRYKYNCKERLIISIQNDPQYIKIKK